MANQKQLKILRQGVVAWNKWRKDNPEVKPDLRYHLFKEQNFSEIIFSKTDARGAYFQNVNFEHANLDDINLRGANFIDVNLTRAELRNADFSGATLKRTNFFHSELNGSKFRGLCLKSIFFKRANLEETDFSRANLQLADLRYANLRKANLNEAILWSANFNWADLSEANLCDADLSRSIGLGTNFSNAILTGVRVENWNIDSTTNLKNISCKYCYLKSKKGERRPSGNNRDFKPSEFTTLFQKALSTIDLIFSDGIDWRAFLLSLEELQNEYGKENVGVQAIERKSGNSFVIRVEVPPEVNKAKIEESFWSKYKPLLKDKDREIKLLSQQTEFYSEQIEVIRKDNTRLLGIVETMAEKETSKVNMTFNAPVTGVAGNVEGDQNIYASEQKQTLAEAAAEIQKLLKQLEQTNPNATPEQQKAYVDAAIPSTLKQRCVSALIAGGETAIDEFFDNPFAKVGKAIVRAWIQP